MLLKNNFTFKSKYKNLSLFNSMLGGQKIQNDDQKEHFSQICQFFRTMGYSDLDLKAA